jgi:hypothetical protein
MQLGISSDAAPDATAADLFAACTNRGLSAIELTAQTAAKTKDIVGVLRSLRRESVRVVGILGSATTYAHQLSALSRNVRAPVVVNGAEELGARITFARSIIAHGGTALVTVSGPAPVWLDTVARASIGFAWQVDAACTDPAHDADLILTAMGRIPYVRLVGGGPEAALQEGRGVGPLLSRLALAGFAGPLILTPSSHRYRIAWASWLGRRGGWGCGSKADRAERELIPLQL